MNKATFYSTGIREQTLDDFAATRKAWLVGRPASTRRSYGTALAQFLEHAGKDPQDVVVADVAAWKESLQRAGLADTTVAQRLSALSSYFAFLEQAAPAMPESGDRSRPESNPVGSVSRDDLDLRPYRKMKVLSPADFRRILAQIDTDTVIGARDRAMLLLYVLCGSRRQEVVSLTGADLEERDGRVFYRVADGSFPETVIQWRELPPPVWDAIEHYLALSGRTLTPESPVFTATRRRAERPLSGSAVGLALKRYATAAGLDDGAVNLNALRHLGARLLQESGGDEQALQHFLNHAHRQTTRVYVAALGEKNRPYWAEMNEQLQSGSGLQS